MENPFAGGSVLAIKISILQFNNIKMDVIRELVRVRLYFNFLIQVI